MVIGGGRKDDDGKPQCSLRWSIFEAFHHALDELEPGKFQKPVDEVGETGGTGDKGVKFKFK